MTEFAFDMVLTTTVRVQADSLGEAVAYLREQLATWSPQDGMALPVGGADGVSRAVLAELNLGGHTLLKGGPAPALMLFEAGGAPVSTSDGVDLDKMQRPQVCERWLAAADTEGCEAVYDEARGDGYCGVCPACADADED